MKYKILATLLGIITGAAFILSFGCFIVIIMAPTTQSLSESTIKSLMIGNTTIIVISGIIVGIIFGKDAYKKIKK
ncbi:MAG: hypothetical protein M0R03_17130 [Novosphingobium sp.]|nr:hypothetical protein [Novosphingobium sp.]